MSPIFIVPSSRWLFADPPPTIIPTTLTDSNGLGTVYFDEQLKFSLLQTLILVELWMTSSSPVVGGLCGAGVVVLIATTLIVHVEKAYDTLAFLFPMLLIFSTAMLTAIVLIKALVEKEVVDVNLVFLGIAFTVDNLLMFAKIVPLSAMAFYQSEGGKRESLRRPISGSVVVRGKMGWAKYGLDKAKATILFLFPLLACLVCVVQAPLAAACTFLVYHLAVMPRMPKWQAEANSSSHGENISADDSNRTKQGIKRILFLYSCVVLVDFEFIGVVIAMSTITGGSQLGGQKYNVPVANADCCCAGAFIGNHSGC